MMLSQMSWAKDDDRPIGFDGIDVRLMDEGYRRDRGLRVWTVRLQGLVSLSRWWYSANGRV